MKANKECYKIGRFQLGWRMVDVYVEPYQAGGWFNVCRNGEDSQIHIGLNYDEWHEVHAVLTHECFEFALADKGCSFKCADAFVPSASDTVHFFMNHNEFTEAVAKASYFLVNTVPKIYGEWKKAKKARSKGE